MLHSLRRSYAELVTSSAQLLLLFAGIHFETRNAWLACLALIAAISVFAWLSALKRLRAIRDTPTSKINSAAQGYVELIGRGEQFGDTPLLSRLKYFPCLWYRYKIERRTSEDEWKTEDSGESFDSFLLRDSSGVCVVDPEHAEISTTHRDHWPLDDYRYTEWTLLAQDPIYVIGAFRTKSCSFEFDSRAELNALLTEWKRDMSALHKRFDLDNDGELNTDEWQLARQAGRREVDKNRREAQALPDIKIIEKPRDGKFFIISNLPPEKLTRRYLLWSWLHLFIFFAAMAGLGWVM